jgi:histidinol phosphatase-like enzyme (inositol monophosphatase family)
MQDFIDLATYLADEAGKIIRPYFRQPFEVNAKSDASPVTIADKSVEERLRAIIEEKRPEDGIIGEEFGIKESKNQYDWVFDPIDGTKSFVIGRPTFGTLIALCEDGVPILGIIDQPILNERWVGAKGKPTTFNGAIVKTRDCQDISNARIISTHPIMVDNWPLIDQESNFYVWGGDCYSFGLLASGFLDCAIESHLGTYDFAALPPIIEGAGGHMCDWHGNPLTLQSDDHVVAVGDIALKDQILDVLK